ncbi:hypothetical protein QZH41_011928 [Actinostola sp. cb2023]|nr:hypothetical protein QZH41_011928 [Actinostola sp. cb2023]
MNQKSVKVPLGVIFKNENINEDMLDILHQFHKYLPKTVDGGFDGQLFAGDQLTVERAVNVISSVNNGYTPETRLEGINLQLGDWHAGVKILDVIFKRFFSGKSEGDICTLYSDRTLINRRNVRGDPHKGYRADRDFFIIVLTSRVIASAMKVLGFEDKSSDPIKCPLPENITTLRKLQKMQYLHKAAALIVDEFVFNDDSVGFMINEVITAQEKQDILDQQQLTPDGMFKCRFVGCNQNFKYDGKSRRAHELTHNPPPEIPDLLISPTPQKPLLSAKKKCEDDIFNYNCALLADGLFFMNFLDAVKEGDGTRLMRQYKFLLLYCRADGQHSRKYALECLYQSFLVNSLLSPRDSERFIWNRGVNTSGGKDTNIPLDLDVEHSNRFIKEAIKNLGPNVTEKAVQRICHAESSTSLIINNIDHSLHRVVGSGRHTSSSTERDLHVLVNRAVSTDVFFIHPNRNYNHYSNFERNPFKNLDMSAMYTWMNKHKNNIVLGNRAR